MNTSGKSEGWAPPASQDRATDAPHEAASASSPSGSVPHGAEVAEAAAATLRPELFEPTIRKIADDLYEKLLDGVQDYLISNVGFNIGTRIEAAERESRNLRELNADLIAALSRCRTGIAGYNITSTSQVPELLSSFLSELHRIDKVASDALATAKAA